MDEPRITGLDVGTSKIKMYIYDESMVPTKGYHIRNTTRLQGAIAEQDPLKLLETIKGLIEKSARLGSRIIGLSTYRGSLVIWGKDKKPLSPIITWMDLRSTINYNRLPLKARISAKLPFIGPALSPESLGTRLKTYLLDSPSLEKPLAEGKAYAWNIDGYLTYMLTGKYAADPSTAALTGLINPRTLRPLGIVFNLLNLPKIQIPELVMHDSLSLEVPSDQVVIGGLIGDQQAASIGLDCLDRGCMKISLGTGFFVDLSLGKRSPPSRYPSGTIPVALYVGSDSRIAGVEGYLTGMGKSVEWFVENMFGGSYREMDESITPASPPLVVPYIWGGRTPRLSRGVSGIIGLQPGYTMKSIANGLAHGVAAALSYVYNVLKEKYGPPSDIRVTGGLIRLTRFNELVASYLGEKIRVSRRHDTSALGAALLAAKSQGINVTFEQEFQEIDPDPELAVLDSREIVEWAMVIQKKMKNPYSIM